MVFQATRLARIVHETRSQQVVRASCGLGPMLFTYWSKCLRAQQFPNGLSDSPKNILLSPSGGGEDEGEGGEVWRASPHPYPLPSGERELRRAVDGPPPRGDFSRHGLSEHHWG